MNPQFEIRAVSESVIFSFDYQAVKRSLLQFENKCVRELLNTIGKFHSDSEKAISKEFQKRKDLELTAVESEKQRQKEKEQDKLLRDAESRQSHHGYITKDEGLCDDNEAEKLQELFAKRRVSKLRQKMKSRFEREESLAYIPLRAGMVCTDTAPSDGRISPRLEEEFESVFIPPATENDIGRWLCSRFRRTVPRK